MVDSTLEAPEPTAGVEETPLTAEAPAAPEGASPPAAGDEPDPAGKAPSQSTRPRDAHGRFIKADGTVASDAEQAQMEQSIAPPVAPAPTSPPVAAVPAGAPFVVRGDGQRLTMPGSTLTPQGDLLVQAEHIPTYRQLIAEGLAHRGSWRQRETEYKQQIEHAGAAAEARVAKYNDASVYLFDLISDRSKLAALVESPERIEMVRERLALMLERHDLNIPKTAATPAEQQPSANNDAVMEQAARATLDGYLEELLESPQAKAVYDTPEKRQALGKRFQRRLNAYFQEHDGGIALHENSVDEDFKEELQERLEARKLALQTAKAAEFNATRRPNPPAAPPVVSTKGSGSTGNTSERVFKSKEEYRRAMGLP